MVELKTIKINNKIYYTLESKFKIDFKMLFDVNDFNDCKKYRLIDTPDGLKQYFLSKRSGFIYFVYYENDKILNIHLPEIDTKITYKNIDYGKLNIYLRKYALNPIHLLLIIINENGEQEIIVQRYKRDDEEIMTYEEFLNN